MCGIFGFAKREDWQSETQMTRINDTLTYLAYNSVVRGQDSTGISIFSGDESATYKTLKASDELVCSKEWDNIVDTITPKTTVAMGHVRLATQGEITTRNAHPFQIGSVVGAHNGIIMNHEEVCEKINKSVEVDSEVIFGLINRKESIQEALDLIYGDYAISWVKDNPHTINLLHEKGRPLYTAYWKKARCLFWASTFQILSESLREAGLQIKVSHLPIDVVHSFDTREFWKEANPETEKVVSNAGGYWGYKSKYGSYGVSKRNYNRSSYGYVKNQCLYCWELTYNPDKICSNCQGYSSFGGNTLKLDSDGNWSANCEDCKQKKMYDELVWIGRAYSCHECIAWNDEKSGCICDYCGDDVWEGEIVEVDGYKVCSYCDETNKKYDYRNQVRLPITT